MSTLCFSNVSPHVYNMSHKHLCLLSPSAIPSLPSTPDTCTERTLCISSRCYVGPQHPPRGAIQFVVDLRQYNPSRAPRTTGLPVWSDR